MIRNSIITRLIILLSLFEDLPLDRFEKAGKDARYLSQNERDKLKELLKDTLEI